MQKKTHHVVERLLILVGRLVPGTPKVEWLAEWKAEFRSTPNPTFRFTAKRLAGALEDALRLRFRTLWRDAMITQDIKQAVRRFRRQPLFAVVVVGILALGLGANTAVFALVEATMIRPLPFRDGDELVHFWQLLEDDARSNFSHPTFVSIRERAGSMAEVAAYHSPSMTLARDGEARTVEAVRVSPNFFSLLGVESALGRSFRAGDDLLSADRVVILSDGFWRTELGADPEVIGTVLVLDSTPYTVIGVLPRHFVFPRERRAEVWRPLIATEREVTARGFRWMHIVGRLAGGTRIESAQSEMDAIAADLARIPGSDGHGILLVSMREQVMGDTRPALTAVYGAVLLVLVITCANLAHLILASITSRRNEIAVRLALGATRWQLVRQVLVEVVLLFLGGGIAGALFASWLLGAVVDIMPDDAMLQAPFLGELGMSVRVLGYNLGLALACGALFGLIPALRLPGSREARAPASTRIAPPRAGARLLVASQVAIAVMLLATTFLLVRSTLELLDVDPGFDTDNLMTLRISLAGAAYNDGARIAAFNHELVRRVAALPGVVGAAAVDRVPLSGNLATTSLGLPSADSDADLVRTNVHLITPEYFDVMGMPLSAGRRLVATDTAGSQPVVVINELLAAALFGDRSPLGRQVVTGGGGTTLEVVGVVGDVKVHTIEEPAAPALYLHTDQFPGRSTGLVVRTREEPAVLVNAVRTQVTTIDPALDIYEVASMREMIDASPAMLTRTIPAVLLSGFAVFATFLVGLGLFAVVAHDVAARTREIGIRRAIGALPGSVAREVTAGTIAVVAIGVAVGSVAAVASARLLQSILFGVGAADPAALLGTGVAVLAVAVLACAVPVRRALNVDPTQALRAE